jgi:multisubunit Na+/H+ antiporter MnhE subunit
MTRFVLRTFALTALYLLVLTSMHPGDVLTGAALSAALAAASACAHPRRALGRSWLGRLAAAPTLVVGTLADMIRGTWHVALYVVGRRSLESPGIVAIPRGERTALGVAVWGYTTAIAPDEIVVDADDERDVLLVHLLDARDEAAIRARHHRTYEQRQRPVFP